MRNRCELAYRDASWWLMPGMCLHCGTQQEVWLTDEEAKGVREFLNGKAVQKALPEWDASRRELLLTGTHPKCWDEMWAEDEEETG